jgi:hypothetical protein
VRLESDEASAATVTARRGKVVVARGQAELAAGRPRNVTLRLTRAGKSRMRKRARLAVVFEVEGRDSAGNVGSATARGVLRR